MQTIEETGLTFLVVTNQFWCKDTKLAPAKRRASRNGKFTKGEKRKYRVLLVHADTVINEMGDIEFPNQLAAETALDLGYL